MGRTVLPRQTQESPRLCFSPGPTSMIFLVQKAPGKRLHLCKAGLPRETEYRGFTLLL